MSNNDDADYKLKEYFKKFNIKDIKLDSRDVKNGDAFFAFNGINNNGNLYIDKALELGASLVFTDDPTKSNDQNVIYVEDARLSLALGAGIIYNKKPKNLVSVTGTNGKSSVVSYVNQILYLLGYKSCSMGTLGIESFHLSDELLKKYPKSLTTPDAVNFRKILNDLAKHGIEYVAFEASSQGLDQKRLGNIKVKSAAFTSFSVDHLDYHKTMENYLQSKLKLFAENLEENGEAIVYSEIDNFDLIKNFLKEHNIKLFTVGKNADLQIEETKQCLSGQEISFKFMNKNYKFKTDIIGSYQANNMLIAARLVNNMGIGFDEIVEQLVNLKAVKGRLERVTKIDDDISVFIDYAHTPDALEKSLSEFKSIKSPNTKLWVLSGCGGNRDTTKRPIMGKIASDIADMVIVTDDNCRNEDPAQIRKEIIQGAATRNNIIEIEDRTEAIRQAVKILGKGDVLILAGKGHEDYLIIGDKIIPFDEAKIVKEALDQRKKSHKA